MLYVVGIGPGNNKYITEVAKDIIDNSEIIIAGKRNIEALGKVDKEVFYISSNLNEMKNYILNNAQKNIVVLASGDPSIYGIASYINRELEGKIDIKIIAGISSIQYAFSAFAIDMNDVYISSSHGREPDYDFILMHKKIAMVTDKNIGPYEIAQEIKNRNMIYDMYIGENLSYPNERLEITNSNDIKNRDYKMSLVILIKK
ncbi:precorrin-6y C5,15-methyltransferase (decarboxylating) subunit CbiE [Peptostreptococcus russellii]|uniref:precorrin-6y C5,15-methyltransferase (decarboxylating) subunit CbiE n=1 Tax=Peptostreptococcus russellii TaxID=215200 RepID=UPI003F5808B8